MRAPIFSSWLNTVIHHNLKLSSHHSRLEKNRQTEFFEKTDHPWKSPAPLHARRQHGITKTGPFAFTSRANDLPRMFTTMFEEQQDLLVDTVWCPARCTDPILKLSHGDFLPTRERTINNDLDGNRKRPLLKPDNLCSDDGICLKHKRHKVRLQVRAFRQTSRSKRYANGGQAIHQKQFSSRYRVLTQIQKLSFTSWFASAWWTTRQALFRSGL